MFGGGTIGANIAKYGSNIAMFELLRQYPAATFMSVLTLVLILISFNTQAEAVAYTLSSMTTVGFDESGEEKDTPKVTTIFWGSLLALVTIILFYTGGEASMRALQTSVVVCGLPIVFLLVIMAFSYVKCMRNCKKYDIVGTFDDPLYRDIVADQIEDETVQTELAKAQ